MAKQAMAYPDQTFHKFPSETIFVSFRNVVKGITSILNCKMFGRGSHGKCKVLPRKSDPEIQTKPKQCYTYTCGIRKGIEAFLECVYIHDRSPVDRLRQSIRSKESACVCKQWQGSSSKYLFLFLHSLHVSSTYTARGSC